MFARDPEYTESPMWCCEGNANHRANVETKCAGPLLQVREPFIEIPISDVQRLLGVVNKPDRSFFQSEIRGRQWPLTPCTPFDFARIPLEDLDIEMIKGNEFYKHVSKSSR